jgi:hypothetical protein
LGRKRAFAAILDISITITVTAFTRHKLARPILATGPGVVQLALLSAGSAIFGSIERLATVSNVLIAIAVAAHTLNKRTYAAFTTGNRVGKLAFLSAFAAICQGIEWRLTTVIEISIAIAVPRFFAANSILASLPRTGSATLSAIGQRVERGLAAVFWDSVAVIEIFFTLTDGANPITATDRGHVG